jgi:hypothetical protein
MTTIAGRWLNAKINEHDDDDDDDEELWCCENEHDEHSERDRHTHTS